LVVIAVDFHAQQAKLGLAVIVEDSLVQRDRLAATVEANPALGKLV
jgi:hypothetical protein